MPRPFGLVILLKAALFTGALLIGALTGALLIGALTGALLAPPALARDSIIAVPSRPGVTQSFILMEPDGPARAVVVAWPSGDGVIGLTQAGMTDTVAFFPRAAERFIAAGLALAIADVPSDKPMGLDYDFRTRPAHVADVAAVIAAVRARTDAPIVLAGFSRATLTAASAAARLPPGTIAGVILASSVTQRTALATRTLFDTPLAEIRVPVLVLHHAADDCAITPPAGVPALLEALTAAPRKEAKVLQGGAPGGCFAHTVHDFYGSEDPAVSAIREWTDAVLGDRSNPAPPAPR